MCFLGGSLWLEKSSDARIDFGYNLLKKNFGWQKSQTYEMDSLRAF